MCSQWMQATLTCKFASSHPMWIPPKINNLWWTFQRYHNSFNNADHVCSQPWTNCSAAEGRNVWRLIKNVDIWLLQAITSKNSWNVEDLIIFLGMDQKRSPPSRFVLILSSIWVPSETFQSRTAWQHEQDNIFLLIRPFAIRPDGTQTVITRHVTVHEQ